MSNALQIINEQSKRINGYNNENIKVFLLFYAKVVAYFMCMRLVFFAKLDYVLGRNPNDLVSDQADVGT